MRILTLIGAAACLLLPGLWALLGFGLLLGPWVWTQRQHPARFWLLVAAAAVMALLLVEALVDPSSDAPASVRRQVERGYQELWQGLDDAANRTAAELTDLSALRQEPLAVFRLLSRQATAIGGYDPTLLLVGPGGRVRAWGGQGLLHDIAEDLDLAEGRAHLASFSAATLVSVRSLPGPGEPWYLAAGLSLRSDHFPFAPVAGEAPRWTIVAQGAPADEGALRIAAGSGPELIIEGDWLDTPDSEGGLPSSGWRRISWLVWGACLLGFALMACRASVGGQQVESWSAVLGSALLAAAGSSLWGLGLETPLWVVGLLAAAGFTAWSTWPVARHRRSTITAALIGAMAALVVPGLASILGRYVELVDLRSALGLGLHQLATRVALALLTWGVLGWVGSRPRGDTRPSSRLLGVGFTLLVVAASMLEKTLVSLAMLTASGMVFALWKHRRGLDGPRITATALALAASLLAATGWEAIFRATQREAVRGPLLAAMAPPTSSEIEALADEMQTFLSSADLGALAPIDIEGLSRQDLAFEIWHHSPLVRYGGLSAIRVRPDDGGLSSFSFGLPLNRESWVDWASPLWGSAAVPAWEDAVLVGDGELRSDGEPWAYAEYALVLQPGFRLRRARDADLAEVLLRAGPGAGEPAFLRGSDAAYALYSREGQPIVSPWPQPPVLPAPLLTGAEGRVDTPGGPALAFSALGPDGVRVLFLEWLSIPTALERAGTHALPTVMFLAAVILLAQTPKLLRQGLRESWYHLWHSYSRRLVLVYSVLLLLPLGLINFLVVRAFEDKLVRDQEAAGLLAMESAQGVLGEYVLALQPGFGINAALDDEVLFWLSGVVHHDVNLYWRGSVYASSKAELFTAGLLPRRIPGEIYSRLTLLGHEVSMRTNRAGSAEYLELYAPLTVPGVSFDQTRLIVSLPLLAQQEETAAQINSLRRRSLLGTAAMVLLIALAGSRLARRFTTPLTDIVAGTQRIAAGEASLNLKPVELELATLVEAIDDMAGRIHAGRQELLREKSVVERMVENITAGVISLDHDNRVLMANRVAVDLMGVEIGAELRDAVSSQERLAPLVGFLAELEPRQLTQKTVTLTAEPGEEQEWTVVWVPLPGEGEPSTLLVLEDVTEVLRGQRLEAWAEMARMIAHEIKNPLTPIRLSAEHMQEVHASDPEGFAEVFESCTSNILQQVGELQEIASDFSTYSRIPRIEPKRGDLVSELREVIQAYGSAHRQGVSVRFEPQEQRLMAAFDPKLLGRAVRNLIENALRATPNGGQVVVELTAGHGEARIAVKDDGPGVKESLLQKIFDPYFSTHDAGTGLGLPIARRIAEEHGGGITARNRRTGGLEVILTLPMGSA